MDTAFAQAVTKAPSAPVSPTMALLGSPLAMMVPIAILFYFLLVAPQNKERKKRQEMLNTIQRGDRVLTRGGLYGTVADIKDQVLILKINENNKVEIDRAYIETIQKLS
jgi:preprotein translocase subunit YajC